MAVNFFNRLIVSGPPARVSDFQARAERTFERSVGEVHWTEYMPISFVALARITPMFPVDEDTSEPYQLCAWPVRRVSPRRAEVRYQFETRAVDFSPALRKLSRKLPLLTFRLMTFCLDDDDVETWEIRAGKMRYRRVSDSRREVHWETARRKFGLEGDDVYDDDDATRFAEGRMFVEALGGWEKRNGKPRRVDWTPYAVFMTLEDERRISLAAVAEALRLEEKARRSKRKVKTAGGGVPKRTSRRS